MSDIRIGDPVIDQANGRAMVVIDKAADRADDWSDRNDYDLLSNYGNERCGATATDSVWTCVYVASLQSEPSKSYAFPSSRLGRPAYERAGDDSARVYDIVARDVLDRLFQHAHEGVGLDAIARNAGFDSALVDECVELATAAEFGGDDD